MAYHNIKQALKKYKSKGRTVIKLNSNDEKLHLELVRLVMQDLPDLTKENTATDKSKNRVFIINKQCPCWGVKALVFDGVFYIWENAVLFPSEFKFWSLVPRVISEDLEWTDLAMAANSLPLLRKQGC
jgi:hypothetical protein